MLTDRQVIDQYYLETRCQLLEIAATLDRYDRAARESEAPTGRDHRWEQILQSLELLAKRQARPERAEELLRLFSDPAE